VVVLSSLKKSTLPAMEVLLPWALLWAHEVNSPLAAPALLFNLSVISLMPARSSHWMS
jgi:hypothetical protein